MFFLFRQAGARSFYAVVFLNAVVDLGHKIILQNAIFKAHDDSEQVVLTAIINALIILPYVLLFVPIGRVADTMPKPRLMRVTVTLIPFLLVALGFFYYFGYFWLAFFATFLLSSQSAFFSPAKLGYLKTLFGEDRLSQSNGLCQGVAIAGILLSTVAFSLLFEYLYAHPTLGAVSAAGAEIAPIKSQILQSMYPVIFVLFALALLQLFLVFRIPVLKEAGQSKEVKSKAFSDLSTGGRSRWRGLLSAPQFLYPCLGLACYWALGQGVLAVFPAIAKSQAGITNTAIVQGVLTCTALGVCIGAWLVSQTSATRAGQVQPQLAGYGLFVIVLVLLMLSMVTSAWLYALLYLAAGIASGLVIVTLNAYIQKQAQPDNIGSVIATSNLLNNLSMLGILAVTVVVALTGVSALQLLLGLVISGFICASFLHPRLARLY